MTVKDLIDSNIGEVLCEGANLDKVITGPFCCDLLSMALGRASAGNAWVTVMGNINTIAVASLTEVSCIVLAEGVDLDEAAEKKAKEGELCIIKTPLSIFDAALHIYKLIHDSSFL